MTMGDNTMLSIAGSVWSEYVESVALLADGVDGRSAEPTQASRFIEKQMFCVDTVTAMVTNLRFSGLSTLLQRKALATYLKDVDQTVLETLTTQHMVWMVRCRVNGIDVQLLELWVKEMLTHMSVQNRQLALNKPVSLTDDTLQKLVEHSTRLECDFTFASTALVELPWLLFIIALTVN